MNLGTNTNDRYRAVTAALMPAGSTKRQACGSCRRVKSIGQFAQGAADCITCKPMPKGWRRGMP